MLPEGNPLLLILLLLLLPNPKQQPPPQQNITNARLVAHRLVRGKISKHANSANYCCRCCYCSSLISLQLLALLIRVRGETTQGCLLLWGANEQTRTCVRVRALCMLCVFAPMAQETLFSGILSTLPPPPHPTPLFATQHHESRKQDGDRRPTWGWGCSLTVQTLPCSARSPHDRHTTYLLTTGARPACSRYCGPKPPPPSPKSPQCIIARKRFRCCEMPPNSVISVNSMSQRLPIDMTIEILFRS